jgi:hypothetical protein
MLLTFGVSIFIAIRVRYPFILFQRFVVEVIFLIKLIATSKRYHIRAEIIVLTDFLLHIQYWLS